MAKTPVKKTPARKAAPKRKAPLKRASKVMGKPAAKRAKAPEPKLAEVRADGRNVDALNVNTPGRSYRREATRYLAAAKALLTILATPAAAKGMTQKEMMVAMRAALPREMFPGTTSSWWMKTVQLDLEARGLVTRDSGKPLRWRKA